MAFARDNRYIANQYWTDKDTGERVTKFARITEAISKEKRPYGNIDENVYELVNGEYPIGTITTFTVTINTPAVQSKAAPEARNMKLPQRENQ